jgi:AcrR family transcriptional regulator
MTRADAVRNRHRAIESARAVLAERGLDAPLDEIARRAGIGNATLYRHFPASCDLVVAACADALRGIAAASERALDQHDAWAALTACSCTSASCARGIAHSRSCSPPT